MTTTTMPRRISTLQYVRARIAVRLGFEKEPDGADTIGWAQQLHAMRLADQADVRRLSDIPTAVVKPVRQPIAAIAATPHREIDDEHLGVLRVTSLEPARIFDHLTAGTR